MKKILWVKFGWSDFYRGGKVDGNFGWLNDNRGKKNEGKGHEAFNFNPGPDGTYYCYVPPQKKAYAPTNEDNKGWTVICLAKNPKHQGIHIVGWYENATLHGRWLEPPAGTMQRRGDAHHPAYDWSYCISSKEAFIIPSGLRTLPFSDSSIRQGKFSFLEGPGVDQKPNKRRVLKLLDQRMQELAPFAVKNPDHENLPDPELDGSDPLNAFGSAEHRKLVETSAENAVVEYYRAKGFKEIRKTHLPCGYDFDFVKGKAALHVEVKGTSSPNPQFFLTRNEYTKGLVKNTSWRLAMVTSALSDKPEVSVYDAKSLEKSFDIDPYVYIGKFVPKVEN